MCIRDKSCTEWRHIRWEATISKDSRATNVISLDGVAAPPIVSSSLPIVGANFALGDRVAITLTAPWKIRLDNVVLRVE